MLNSTVFERLEKLIGYLPRQKELASLTQIKQSTLSSKASRNSLWTESELKKLNEAYGIDIFKDITQNITGDDFVNAYYYPENFGRVENGVFRLSDNRFPVKLPKKYLFKELNPAKEYSVINYYGEAMLPLIHDKDKLIIEHIKEDEQILDNRIYAFCLDNRIFVKRIIYNIDELILKSENQDTVYKTKFIPKHEINNIFVIGQAAGIARDIK